MSMKDGGPVFPCSWSEEYGDADEHGDRDARLIYHDGMSLRDYFAGQALQGLIASNDEGAGDRIADLPGYAYDIADAMLKARAQQ